MTPLQSKPDEHVIMASTVAKFIATFGLGTAIAVYLLYFMTQTLNAQLVALQNSMNNAQSMMINHQADVDYLVKAYGQSDSQLRTLNLTLQSICVNTASNAQSRNSCFRTAN